MPLAVNHDGSDMRLHHVVVVDQVPITPYCLTSAGQGLLSSVPWSDRRLPFTWPCPRIRPCPESIWCKRPPRKQKQPQMTVVRLPKICAATRQH
jgi:hypothetical protein